MPSNTSLGLAIGVAVSGAPTASVPAKRSGTQKSTMILERSSTMAIGVALVTALPASTWMMPTMPPIGEMIERRFSASSASRTCSRALLDDELGVLHLHRRDGVRVASAR